MDKVFGIMYFFVRSTSKYFIAIDERKNAFNETISLLASPSIMPRWYFISGRKRRIDSFEEMT